MTIAQAIRHMAAGNTEMYCKVCRVDAVDTRARTVDCTPLDDSAPLLGVNLQANQQSEQGVVAFPVQGSYVVVGFLSPAVAVVVLAEEIDKIDLKIGGTTAQLIDGQIDAAVERTTLKITSEGVVINGGERGSLVNIAELTRKLNEFITAFNNHTHQLPTGAVAVAGTATAQANPAPVAVPPVASPHQAVAVSDYEDVKVKH